MPKSAKIPKEKKQKKPKVKVESPVKKIAKKEQEELKAAKAATALARARVAEKRAQLSAAKEEEEKIRAFKGRARDAPDAMADSLFYAVKGSPRGDDTPAVAGVESMMNLSGMDDAMVLDSDLPEYASKKKKSK